MVLQSILVLLIIVEMLAVSGETLIERGWLDFDGPRDPGDPCAPCPRLRTALHMAVNAQGENAPPLLGRRTAGLDLPI